MMMKLLLLLLMIVVAVVKNVDGNMTNPNTANRGIFPVDQRLLFLQCIYRRRNRVALELEVVQFHQNRSC